MRNILIVLIAVAGALSACSADRGTPAGAIGEQTASRQESLADGGIAWFEGSIEQAFAAARAEKKPIFLYWGAQWCPPCHELRSTIFRRDEFVEQSRLFVPVYLDGDTTRAQKYGEQFGVWGYPTVIILDPEGVEITRIPGGMNIEQYLDVLELALNALRPVKDLVQAVQAGEDIRDDDWRLLASYSWEQDRGKALGEDGGYAALREMAQACPDRLANTKSKLQVLAILSWAADPERDESLAAEYGLLLERVLGDSVLARENLSLFIQGGADMVRAMNGEGQGPAIRERLAAQLAAATQDPSNGVLTRIDALYGWVAVSLALLDEGETLSEQQQEWVKTRVMATRSSIDKYQQHAALNSISAIYRDAGLTAEARASLREGIAVSKQPYYFMSGMAYLEKEAGNSDAAISWSKKAWEAAQGPATRVQWGSNYVFTLVELRPDDAEAINTAGSAVLAELAQQKDGLYQRNSGRMDRLSRSLLEWAEPAGADESTLQQRKRVLSQLRGQMAKICTGVTAASEASATCDSFLM